jgi:hypothetical protein
VVEGAAIITGPTSVCVIASKGFSLKTARVSSLNAGRGDYRGRVMPAWLTAHSCGRPVTWSEDADDLAYFDAVTDRVHSGCEPLGTRLRDTCLPSPRTVVPCSSRRLPARPGERRVMMLRTWAVVGIADPWKLMTALMVASAGKGRSSWKATPVAEISTSVASTSPWCETSTRSLISARGEVRRCVFRRSSVTTKNREFLRSMPMTRAVRV